VEPVEEGENLTWLWILISVVVAGGIVTAVVLTLPQEEPEIEVIEIKAKKK